MKEAEEAARRLVERLEEKGIRVEEVLLFGSVARGDFRLDSDFDLIVVSRDWGKLPYTRRLDLLYRLWDNPRDATLIPLTRDELRDRLEKSVALRDASRYWIRVYPRDSRKEG